VTVEIIEGGLDRDDVRALLEHHVATARAETARGSAHALNLAGLQSPDIRFWCVRDGEGLLGVGALRALTARHGEIKSMHTAERARRRGVGRLLVNHIIDEARAMGMTRLSLETGSWDYFVPARSLYKSLGFAACPPFGDYREDRTASS
jgi:putative acetyltransferase